MQVSRSQETCSLLRLATALILLLSSALTHGQTNVTPDQWLALQPKPNFKPGHRLALLSKFSWPFPIPLRVELARNWGYALEFNGSASLVNGQLERDLGNPNSIPAQILSICSNNAGQFRLQVDLDRNWPSNLSRGFWVTNAQGLFVDQKTNTWSDPNSTTFTKIVSPEASDADLALQAESIVAPLRLISSKAQIGIVMNGGERDMGVVGFERPAWAHDPRVQKSAVVTNPYAFPGNTNGLSWPRYSSQQKARHLSHLTDAVRAASPQHQLYIWYNSGNEQARFNRPGYDWENQWSSWGWLSDYINPALEIPSFESYYIQGSWTNATDATWNKIGDLLTRHLNSVAYNLRIGYPTNYSFVCAGWSNSNSNRLSEISRYKGFLKCLYTSGTIGATAGYFEFPTNTTPSTFGNNGFSGTFPLDYPPHWLLQISTLSEVHALFSHLDHFLFEGTLLPGPTQHALSLDLPAYEFPNSASDPNCRVLVRKLVTREEWLITAWAASGPNRELTVHIPQLGNITILARSEGTMYRATLTSTTQIDTPPLAPSQLRALVPNP